MIPNTWNKLECGHRQNHCLSWNRARSYAKITQRIVLSFVLAVFDTLGICSPFTIRMRFLLKSIWAAMGQAWDKELSA